MAVALIVKAVLLNEMGQVLVLRRSQTDVRRPGDIDFPGGTAERGEDVLEAGAREIFEETGINIKARDLKIVYTSMTEYESPKSVVIRVLCGAQVLNPEITLSFEHDQFEWVAIAEAVKRWGSHEWGQGLSYAKEHELLPV